MNKVDKGKTKLGRDEAVTGMCQSIHEYLPDQVKERLEVTVRDPQRTRIAP